MEVEFPFYEEAKDLFLLIIGSDGYDCIKKVIKSEKNVENNARLQTMFSLSQTTRKIISKILNLLG